MRLLFLITGLGLGGAEKVVCDLADQMILIGHTVKIAYLTGEALVKPTCPQIELIPLKLNSISNLLSASKRYKKLVKGYKPDVIHAHMIHANIFARLNRIGCKVPKLICSAHSSNEGGRLRMLAYRYTHTLSDLTTNVSINASNNFETLGAVPLSGIKTIYNGIDLTKFDKKEIHTTLKKELNISDSTPIFLAVGRFNVAKDYPNLLNAFSILKKTAYFKHKQPKLLIAGDGELRSELELLVKNLDLQSNVLLLGKRDDIPVLLNMSDFFVLSSKHEGLPTVVIEAMACGTFVISTDCGGSAEIMGDTGILVPPQNSEALAEALKEAVNKTPLEIQENNFKARQRVEELFSLEKSVQNWLKLYEQN